MVLHAQKQKEIELSNAEKFSEKSGSLIKKTFLDVGKIRGIEFQVIYFTDLLSESKTSALRIEKEISKSYGTETKVAILDADEIDGLMKSIKLIQNNILQSKPENYTEVSYKSRSGFEAGCYSKAEGWDAFIKIEKYDRDSYVFLKNEDLGSIYSFLELAKTKF